VFSFSGMFYSSLSSMMSSTAAVFLQEFIKPCFPKMTDKTATVVSKFVSLALGGVMVLLTFFAKNVGVGLFTVRAMNIYN